MGYDKIYHVYMMASQPNGTLYIGITSYLAQRVYQHKTKTFKGFTAKYNVNLLVWYEGYQEVSDAIAREKQLKKFYRKQKLALINAFNPEWKDLYETLV